MPIGDRNFERIKGNISKLLTQKQPSAVIDKYASDEGVTFDEVKQYVSSTKPIQASIQRQQGRPNAGQMFQGLNQQAQKVLSNPIVQAISPLIPGQMASLNVAPAVLTAGQMAEQAVAEPAVMEQRKSSIPTQQQIRTSLVDNPMIPINPKFLMTQAAPLLGGIGQLGKSIPKVLSGQSKAEIGDVNVGAGMPEKVASTLGLIQAGAIVPDAVQVGRGVNTAIKGMGRALSVGRELSEDVAKQAIKDTVKKSFFKAVKPGQLRGATPNAIERFDNSIANGVTEILNRKGNIITDDAGNLIKRNPENVVEAVEATDNTLKQLHSEYSGIEKKVGKQLWKYDPTNDISDLNRVINDMGILPEERSAARKIANILQGNSGGSVDDVSNKILKKFNAKSKEFYNGKNTILGELYAKVASRVKESMEDGIMNALGTTGHKELRKSYGDVLTMQRALVKRINGLVSKSGNEVSENILNPAIGANILYGIATKDIKSILSSLGGYTIKEVKKLVNSPDFLIKGMFDDADKILKRSPRLSSKYSKAVLGSQQAGRGAYQQQAVKAMGAQRGIGVPKALPYKKQVPQPRVPASSPMMAEEWRVINRPFEPSNVPPIGSEMKGKPLALPAPKYQYGAEGKGQFTVQPRGQQPFAKAPHNLTKQEFIEMRLGKRGTPEQIRSAVIEHKKYVREAIKNGKDVDTSVVKEYNDLASLKNMVARMKKEGRFKMPTKKGQAVFGVPKKR
jgi:hypothetical protein